MKKLKDILKHFKDETIIVVYTNSFSMCYKVKKFLQDCKSFLNYDVTFIAFHNDNVAIKIKL